MSAVQEGNRFRIEGTWDAGCRSLSRDVGGIRRTDYLGGGGGIGRIASFPSMMLSE